MLHFFFKIYGGFLTKCFYTKKRESFLKFNFFHKKKALRIEKITKNTLVIDLLAAISFGSRMLDTSCKSESSK
jgi:hypothetical protein